MSHIENALKKAQKEKDSLYQRYSRVTPAAAYTGYKRPRALWTIGVVVALIILALVVFFLFGGRSPDGKDRPVPRSEAVVEKVPAPQQKSVIATNPKPVSRPETGKQAMPPPPTAENTGGVKKSTDMTVRVETLYRAALNYQRKGNLDMAGKTYENLLHIDPGHVFSLNNLGVIYMSQGQIKNAEAMFRKAIELKDDYVNPFYNLACLYSQEGDISRSLEYLERAVRLNNDVRKWVKDDKDLENVRETEEFKTIFE
ncbi:MAG TPA: tetratricopeptide repeat protein [Syntrophales bacterium]|nr:tetratricopeptide repeat protein [Syntrophales bacterium]HPQ43902.1 tetratricopeptide repeat protein [Syntrophales bacterium]